MANCKVIHHKLPRRIQENYVKKKACLGPDYKLEILITKWWCLPLPVTAVYVSVKKYTDTKFQIMYEENRKHVIQL